jgi:hypothetical protein
MSKTAVIGTGVDFAKTGDGFIVAFLTDANDPAQLNIPAGNWNYEIYAQMSSNGGTPQMYAELYKYDGTTFTLISTSSNEILYDGTALNLYTFAMAVPATTLTLTDRLAVKLYATNSGGKTTTIHTQDGHLCQIITTFSTGITALNGLTAQVQYFQVGTSGSDFNISSTTATHTFNLPTASATNRGALSSADWTTFNNKQNALTNPITGTGTSGQVAYFNGTSSLTSNAAFAFTPTSQLLVNNSVTAASAIARGTNLTPTLTAAANSDVLVGLDVSPTFSNGAFTGVVNYAARISGILAGVTQYMSTGASANFHYLQIVSSSSTNGVVNLLRNAGAAGTYAYQLNNGNGYFSINSSTGETTFGSSSGGYFTNLYSGGTEGLRIFGATRNIVIQNGGTFTDAGFRLDVNGTARVQDNLTVSNNRNAGTGITISNTTSGTTSASQITFTSNSNAFIGKFSSSTSAFRIINPSDLYLLNQSAGDIAIQNDVGNIKFNTTSTGNVQAILFTTGNFAVGTGTDVASAVLQASSTTKGFLPPRMTLAQRTAISSPAEGLIVVQTDGTQGLYLYIGAAWHSITML